MTYMDVVVDKDHMLAFLARPTISYRGHYISSQPMNIFIPFSGYLTLIQDIAYNDLDILRLPLNSYKSAISKGEGSRDILRLYYYDIALSGLAEVKKSSNNGLLCTRIFGMFDESTTKDIKNIDFVDSASFFVNSFSGDEQRFLHSFVSEKFRIEPRIILENRELVDNVYMYSLCLSYLGIFKFNKTFNILVKGS